jgi:hypothetical protein
LQYLLHFGFTDTAQALFRLASPGQTGDQSVAPALPLPPSGCPYDYGKRTRLRSLILAGAMDAAERELPPDLLSRNPGLHCALACQHFLELYARSLGDANAMQADAPSTGWSADTMDVEGGGKSAEDDVPVLLKLVDFGRHIQNLFGVQEAPFQDCLAQVFSLMCYPDPHTSPVAFLLDERNRVDLAEMVHSACMGEFACAWSWSAFG